MFSAKNQGTAPDFSGDALIYIYYVRLSPFRNQKPEFWDAPGWASFKEDTADSRCYAYFKGGSSDPRREIGHPVPRGGGGGTRR